MLNLPQFLFINGPAGSGKSTLARLICEQTPRAWRESFAEPIRDMIQSVFFPEHQPIPSIDLRDSEIKKQNMLVLSALNLPETHIGPTVRQTMIDFSEQYMKPRFGQDIFGRLLWKRCNEQSLFYDHFVIDDSGFAPEAQFIIDKVGAENCFLVRLHRDGCTYAGDSRDYVKLPPLWPNRVINICNDGPPADMISELQLVLGNL